jgi:PKD repeat protein
MVLWMSVRQKRTVRDNGFYLICSILLCFVLLSSAFCYIAGATSESVSIPVQVISISSNQSTPSAVNTECCACSESGFRPDNPLTSAPQKTISHNAPSAIMATNPGGEQTLTFRTDSGYNLDQYLFAPEIISFPIEVNLQGSAVKSATLTLNVYDVDMDPDGCYYGPEIDTVYVNDVYVGTLTGANDQWSTCSFNVNPSLISDGTNTIKIIIDSTNTGCWAVECNWGELELSVTKDKPSINEIKFTPEIPVTGKEVKFTADINEGNGYEVTGIRWEFWEDILVGNIRQSVGWPQTKGGKEDTTNPQIMKWDPGRYGEKKVRCELYARPEKTTDTPELVDKKTIDMKVFFPMVNPGGEAWETTKLATPWAADPTNPISVKGGKQPNWYTYWRKDGAIDGLNDFYYQQAGSEFVPADHSLNIGPLAAAYWGKFIKFTKLAAIPPAALGPEKFAGYYGLTKAAGTVSHENRHKTIDYSWHTGGVFYGTIDSDCVGVNCDLLPDDFENGTLTTPWEPRGSLTNIHNTDTYNFASLDSGYSVYGDEEYLAWRAAEAQKESRKNELNDWSDYSVMAKAQKASPPTSQALIALTQPASVSPLQNITLSRAQLISSTPPNLTRITGPYADNGIDTNGNGLYDILDVSIGLDVNATGNYMLEGWLNDGAGNYVAYASHTENLDAGTYNIVLHFDGIEIQSHGVAGPYLVNVTLLSGLEELFERDYKENAHTTKAYALSQFEGAQISFSNIYSDTGVDTNGDGIFESLQVNIGANIAKAGTYKFSASLEKGTDSITNAFTTVTLSPGSQSVALLFDGNTIGASGLPGPYNVRGVTIQDTDDVILDYANDPWTTSAYTVGQFRPGGIIFTGPFQDQGVDKNANGLFDTLVINTDVDVTVPGNYTIAGTLLDTSNRSIGQVSYEILFDETKPYTIPLEFDGREIHRSGMNGPYTLAFLIAYNDNAQIVDIMPRAYDTATYQVSQFDGINIELSGYYSDQGIDTDGNGLFNYLDLTVGVNVSESGYYAANGRLLDPTGHEIEWASTSDNFNAGEEKNLTFRFDGRRIYGTQQNGSFVFSDLYIYQTSNPSNSFEQRNVYTTGSYAYTDFEPCGIITGVVSTQYGVPVANANVAISGISFVLTDTNGSYSLPVFSTGTYTVVVRPVPSYLDSNTSQVDVTVGQITIHNVQLNSNLLAPQVTGIDPQNGEANSIVQINNITGANFITGAKVNLTNDGTTISATNVMVHSNGNISCRFNLAGAIDGLWDVVVIHPDGQVGIGPDLFLVFSPTPLKAEFTANVTSGIAPLAVQFNDTSTGSPILWNWSFGDNNFSMIQNPVHTYEFAGTFTVSLNATNTAGSNVTERNKYIRVTSATTPSKIGVFRNSTQKWLLDFNGNGIWDGKPTDKKHTFGLSTDVPVTGDWNNDGRTEIGVFRSSTQKWLLDFNGNGIWDGKPTDNKYTFGLSTDKPVTGDWNNDGRTEIGVFRSSTQKWLLDSNGNGIWDGTPTDTLYTFGLSTDKPVTGDWNNDGRTEIGVFRSSTQKWLLDSNGNGIWDGKPTDKKYTFGLSTDLPLTGDWNGDGKTEIGVFRSSTQKWLLDSNGNGIWDGTPTDTLYTFGLSTDKPVSGKW